MFSPDNNYGSKISTASPFGASDYRATLAGKQAYGGPNQSRSVFSRALLDSNKASLFSDMEDARRTYQQKAENARSQDVQSIRENALQNYGLDQQKAVTTKRQDTFGQQKALDLEAYMSRARKDARAATIGNVAELLLQGAFLAAPSAPALMKMGKAGIGYMGRAAQQGALGMSGGLRGDYRMFSPVTDTGYGGFLGGLTY